MKKRTPPKAHADALPCVTLREFLDAQGRGSRKRMADALGVSKGLISGLAKDPEAGAERVFASYGLAVDIRDYVRRFGFALDIETLIRTERAQ